VEEVRFRQGIRFFLLTVFLALFVVVLVVAECPDPPAPCKYCGDGIVSTPNGWGLNEVCDYVGNVGCGTGEQCNSQCTDCIQVGCNNDGDCQSPPETSVNCPNDCCAPNCAGRECGPDGCDGFCAPYYDDCPGSDVCTIAGQCCSPSCPSPSSVSCGSTYTGSNGCGGSCNVQGMKCSGGQWCDTSYHPDKCVSCDDAGDCADGNVCTDDSCNQGTCANTAVPGRTCTPSGYPLNSGSCQADASCVWNGCGENQADCDGDGDCENLLTDNSNCGSCGNACAANESCSNGYCGCVPGTTVDCFPYATGAPGVGLCVAGTRTCNAQGSYGACTGSIGPTTEVCDNGLDEDCDGTADDGCGCTNGAFQDCYSGPGGTQGVGPCHAGTQTCSGGVWGECVGEVTPTAEICNGVDDDCDGSIDEGAQCATGVCCGGSCCDGTCNQGNCEGSCTPTTETCNGVDDDCDGAIDEGVLCNDGDACTADSCLGTAGCNNVAIPADCPKPSAVQCGSALLPLNGCGSCSGYGSDCSSTPATPYCFPSTALGMCRACTSNDHCGEGEACADYACQPCDDETTAGTTLCGTTESVLRCDGTTVSVVGSLCDANGDGMHDAGRVCQEGECIVTQYAISVDYQMVYVVPKQVLLRPVLTDLDGIPVTAPPSFGSTLGGCRRTPKPRAMPTSDRRP
jgi:hypothetical protein